MGSTKIFVVHMKELIKTAVFAVLGVILICLLIYFFIPKEKTEAAIYVPGTYSSAIILHNDPVSIEVSVSENEITAVEMKNLAETQEVFYPLVKPTFESLADEIVKNQSLEVNVSSESQVTGSILIKAVENALEQAKISE